MHNAKYNPKTKLNGKGKGKKGMEDEFIEDAELQPEEESKKKEFPEQERKTVKYRSLLMCFGRAPCPWALD